MEEFVLTRGRPSRLHGRKMGDASQNNHGGKPEDSRSGNRQTTSLSSSRINAVIFIVNSSMTLEISRPTSSHVGRHTYLSRIHPWHTIYLLP